MRVIDALSAGAETLRQLSAESRELMLEAAERRVKALPKPKSEQS